MNSVIRQISIIGIGAALFFLLGCQEPDRKNTSGPRVKHNYVVLLDLSDRILQEGQIERDIAVIEGIYDNFLQRLKTQFYFPAIDEFKIVMAYQEDAVPSSQMYELEDELYINVESVPIDEKKLLRDTGRDFKKKIKELYKLARFSDDPNDYKGADIQGYLRDRLYSDIPKSDSVINFLIILTDGYQYVEGKSRGIDEWPAVRDLREVNVMVVEMSPNLSLVQEKQRMVSAWQNWLESMNALSIKLETKNALTKVLNEVSLFCVQQSKQIEVTNDIRPRSSTDESEQQLSGNTMISQLLPNGDYVSFKDGRVRTLRIVKEGESNSSEIFRCSLIQMGDSFANLEGILDTTTRLMTIDRMGTFSILRDDDSITLSSNGNMMTYRLGL